jgi:hypothetical protein
MLINVFLTKDALKQIILALAVAGVFVAGAVHAESGADVVKAKAI